MRVISSTVMGNCFGANVLASSCIHAYTAVLCALASRISLMTASSPKCLVLLLLSLVVSPTAYAAPMADEIRTISVIADSSLALPVTKIIQQYSTDKHQAVVASYVPVNQQEEAVLEGVGYDVLITARPKILEELKQQGLVDIYTESEVAKNRLVLAASDKSDFQASLAKRFPLADIITKFNWQPGLVVGNPETLLEGSIAREALRNYGVIADLEPYTMYEKDLPEIISMIREEGSLGLVYQSDAKNYQGLRVVDIVPEHTHRPITYIAVVLAGNRMEQSREFVDYLTQRRSKNIFQKHDFSLPE